jgi:type IV pilus assembly protein PilV
MQKQTILGFTFIEILIAMGLVATAMLISLSGQFISRQAAQEFQYKSIAMRHAAELAAWMRLVDEFSRHDVDNAKSIPVLMHEIMNGAVTQSQTNCFYAECSLTQQLRFDYANWAQRLQILVPGVRVVVCRDDQAWDSASQTWHWECDGIDELTPTIIKIGWPHAPTNQNFAPAIVLTVGPVFT